MSSPIAVAGGRGRWSADQKLEILRKTFAPLSPALEDVWRKELGFGHLFHAVLPRDALVPAGANPIARSPKQTA